ncbi:MAG: NAD-glutamate dehydrogenase [Oceanospirillaceae bacterium]|nr:NAD-glutamate dehydrogenase [Oceanospirillaceae bacterium]
MPDSGLPNNKEQLLTRFVESLDTGFPEREVAQISAFARQLFQVVPTGEMLQCAVEDLQGIALSAWQFVQQYDGRKPRVRVFNPDQEQHGWQSRHTVIEVLQQDSPFLVESIRMELNRRELAIHRVCNTVLGLSRRDGQLDSLLPLDDESGRHESLIHLEIDRQSDPEMLKALQQGILDVLTDVQAAVGDFAAMQARVVELRDQLHGADAGEAQAFIDWLLDGHFIFLGIEESAGAAADEVQPQPGRALGIAGRAPALPPLSAPASTLLSFARAGQRSRVHRPDYLDVIGIRRCDETGRVVGECRVLGLYTAPVYRQSVLQIPLIRRKVESVLERAGFSHAGHSRKALLEVLEGLPREELFLAGPSALHRIAMGVFDLQERHRVRLLIRRDTCDRFYSCLYYVPRDLFNSALRERVQQVLAERLDAQEIEFSTRFSDSILARVHFVVRVAPQVEAPIDEAMIEAAVVEASRAWHDELHKALLATCGEEAGNRCNQQFGHAFPSAYREHFGPRSAVIDIQHLDGLSETQPVAMSFYRGLEPVSELLRCKLYRAEAPLVLSEVLPILEQLGFQVLGEHPYPVRTRDGRRLWLHDFTLKPRAGDRVELEAIKPIVQEAFLRLWHGEAENDAFNRLVLAARLPWREVALLRAYARYGKQLRFDFSQTYLADALCRHPQIVRQLVALFRARLDPARQGSDKAGALVERLEQGILEALERVESLDDDKILRRYLTLIRATLRSNYFQPGREGEPKGYFAFKFDPRAIPGVPLPRPRYEIFVYSPRVEGVHLRGGKVARGGLRWSDRQEDYRTEVLGLVKAQQVKNAVIVPVGAKGCFVAKQLPLDGGRDEMQAEGVACYRIFISGLLDLTDNLIGGEVVPPAGVVRRDDDDPYLVVAADKGTATFSDIANTIAADYGFWLGDAFASGGSQGYDHKKMGITARGAWESVRRHFGERNLDVQHQDFRVIGIGDMAGDVFGNGMLLSRHIRLVAAFNHQHIFIDPDPDAAAGCAERERLFRLPRSSWTDYDAALISEGGGVFSRQAKWIAISPQMRECFDIEAERLAPAELISALLRAPVDLIWNGGIGTYVKASHESHAEVGDKANDGLRIDARELRCRALGEGGNLGFTQLARVEFAQHGGACNTDFIDNAGGVDCSDHEVNIKILLNELVAGGEMTLKQRNRLLQEMTDEVATLVLRNNYRQVQALSLAEAHVRRAPEEYLRLIQRLEASGRLDRVLEGLPDDAAFAERQARGQALTRPELAVLMAYARAELKEALVRSPAVTDDCLLPALESAFPARLCEAFPEPLYRHRLRPEIVATQLANDLVNTMGPVFAHRLQQAAGAGLADVVVTYVIARDLFGVPQLWQQIEALDNRLDAALQLEMMTDLQRLVARASRRLLRQCDQPRDPASTLARYRDGIAALGASLSERLGGERLLAWQRRRDDLCENAVPASLAGLVAGVDCLYSALAVVEVAEQSDVPVARVADIYYSLGERLELHWFDQQVNALAAGSHWEVQARDCYRDELDAQLQALTLSVLGLATADRDDNPIEGWLARHAAALERWQQMLTELRSAAQAECAVFSVALRELGQLARRSLEGAG